MCALRAFRLLSTSAGTGPLRAVRSAAVATGLAASLFFGGLHGLPLLAVSPAAAAGMDVAAAEQQFLDLINADRAASGLAPVQPDPRLMDIARWRSEDMAARNYFEHDIGGYDVFKVLSDRQVSFRLAGENIATNTYDDSRTVSVAESALMGSSGHRANILRREFNLIGVGIAIGRDRRVIYTQLFVQT